MPGRDEVDLWTIALDGGEEGLARARAVLNEAERARFDRVLRPEQRDRVILARAALRSILGRYLDEEPAAVGLESGPVGKPVLAPDRGLAFNLSHAGAVAAVAVTTRPAVGVDIETLGRRVSPAVMRRVLAPDELALVYERSESERGDAFLRYWTAKEAYAKALGTGLSVGLQRVVIREGLGDAPSLTEPGSEDWSLQRFDPGPGLVGAVVVAGGPWRARREC